MSSSLCRSCAARRSPSVSATGRAGCGRGAVGAGCFRGRDSSVSPAEEDWGGREAEAEETGSEDLRLPDLEEVNSSWMVDCDLPRWAA